MSFPESLCDTIATYLSKKELLDWIDPEKLNQSFLSFNPNAIDYLKENPKKIIWPYFLTIQNDMDFIMANRAIWEAQFGFENLSRNPSAIEFFKENREKIDWFGMSMNISPEASELIAEKIKEDGSYDFFFFPATVLDLKSTQGECFAYFNGKSADDTSHFGRNGKKS